MKSHSLLCPFVSWVIALALLGVLPCAGSAAAKPKPKAGPQAKAAPRANEAAMDTANAQAKPVEIPQSVFVVVNGPKEGRNPFFPKSTTMQPQPIPDKNKLSGKKSIDLSAVVLNGLTGPPKRLAMINGRTFEAGETAEVKMPGGAKLRVVCEEIKDDSVVVLIANERRELRLRNSL